MYRYDEGVGPGTCSTINNSTLLGTNNAIVFSRSADSALLAPGTYVYFAHMRTESFDVDHNDVDYVDCSNTLSVTGPPDVTLTADKTSITHGDSVDLTWTVASNPPALSCTGSWTGSPLSTTGGTANTGAIPTLVGVPPTASQTYTVTCTNALGSDAGSVDSVTVTVNSKPDLVVTGASLNFLPGNADPVTGIYSSVDVVATLDALYDDVTVSVPYLIELERVDIGTVIKSTTGNIAGGISMSGQTISTTFSNVPFNDYIVRIEIDRPGTPLLGVVSESPAGDDVTNNRLEVTETLPQPPPNITIETQPTFIRRGEIATIDWNVDVGYDVSCVLSGVGINRNDIGFSGGVATNLVGNETTPALDTETDYTIVCTTALNGSKYSATTTVKMLPSVEES